VAKATNGLARGQPLHLLKTLFGTLWAGSGVARWRTWSATPVAPASSSDSAAERGWQLSCVVDHPRNCPLAGPAVRSPAEPLQFFLCRRSRWSNSQGNLSSTKQPALGRGPHGWWRCCQGSPQEAPSTACNVRGSAEKMKRMPRARRPVALCVLGSSDGPRRRQPRQRSKSRSTRRGLSQG
jgi:hypothetical protein